MSFFCLLIAAQSAGFLLLRRPPGASRLVRSAYRTVTGLCVCAVVVIAAGSVVGLRATEIIVCVMAGTGLLAAFLFRQRFQDAPPAEEPRKPLSPGERLCLLVTGGALAIGAISVFSPPTSWDAVVAHLALPAQYVRRGHITVLEGNTYSGYPHLMHALYTYAYATGGETGAQFLSWVLGFLGCVFAYALGERLQGRLCGLITAAVFATTPVFFEQAGVVSIDVAVTTVVAATLAALLGWHEEKRRNWLVLAGFLAGSACGIRHTGYIVCVLYFLGVLAFGGRGSIRAALVFGVLAVVGAAPWILRTWIAVGNPVYPFFQGLFPSNVLINEDFTSLGGHGSRHGARFYEVLWFPWRIVMAPGAFDGWNASPGGLILALGIPGVIVGGPRARMLGLYCLAGVVFFFFFQHLARYMLPFFVAMMPVAALAACRLERLRWLTHTVLALTFAMGLFLGLGMNHFKIPVALGFESRESYLGRRVERYEAFHWVNHNEVMRPPEVDAETALIQQLRGRRRIVVVFTLDPRTYYLERPAFKNYEALVPLTRQPLERQLQWFAKRKIRYLLYPVQYVEGSPRFKTSGLLGTFNEWRGNPEAFRPVKRLTVDSRGQKEEVIIYEIAAPGR